jgi:ligand-binding sensor domain-containing protein
MRHLLRILTISAVAAVVLYGCGHPIIVPDKTFEGPASVVTRVFDGNFVAIKSDSKGTLWAAARDKVMKFDGKTWTTFDKATGLPLTKNIKCLAIDKQDNVYVGTWDHVWGGGDIMKYDGSTWTTYSTLKDFPDKWVWALFVDSKDNVWASTYAGVLKISGTSFKMVHSNPTLAWVAATVREDKSGTIWIGDNIGLMKVVGDGTEQISDDIISSITIDNNGVLHMGRYSGRYARYDGKKLEEKELGGGLHIIQSGGPTTNVLIDTKGRIWFSSYLGVDTYAHGLFKQEKGQWIEFTEKDGVLNNEDVSVLFEDSKGNIWVAAAVGVNKYDGKTWKYFAVPDMKKSWGDNKFLVRHHNAMLEDRSGQLWFATWSGLYRIAKD